MAAPQSQTRGRSVRRDDRIPFSLVPDRGYDSLLKHNSFFREEHVHYATTDAVLGDGVVSIAVDKETGNVYMFVYTAAGSLAIPAWNVHDNKRLIHNVAEEMPASEAKVVHRKEIAVGMLMYFDNIGRELRASLVSSAASLGMVEGALWGLEQAVAFASACEQVNNGRYVGQALSAVAERRGCRNIVFDVIVTDGSSSAPAVQNFLMAFGDEIADKQSSPERPETRQRAVSPLPRPKSDEDRQSAVYDVLHELLATETSYVERLRHLFLDYANPLMAKAKLSQLDTLTPYAIFKLFLPVKVQAMMDLNSAFLTSLQKAGFDAAAVAEACSQHFPLFKDAYETYLDASDQFEMLLKEYQQQSRALEEFVTAVKYKTAHKVGLRELLFEPVQRLPRYTLLINRIIENLPVEQAQIKVRFSSALSHVEKIARMQRKDEEMSSRSFYRIRTLVEGYPADLGASHRKLITAIDVLDVPVPFVEDVHPGTPCTILLLSDCLVLVERRSRDVSGAQSLLKDNGRPIVTKSPTKGSVLLPSQSNLDIQKQTGQQWQMKYVGRVRLDDVTLAEADDGRSLWFNLPAGLGAGYQAWFDARPEMKLVLEWQEGGMFAASQFAKAFFEQKLSLKKTMSISRREFQFKGTRYVAVIYEESRYNSESSRTKMAIKFGSSQSRTMRVQNVIDVTPVADESFIAVPNWEEEENASALKGRRGNVFVERLRYLIWIAAHRNAFPYAEENIIPFVAANRIFVESLLRGPPPPGSPKKPRPLSLNVPIGPPPMKTATSSQSLPLDASARAGWNIQHKNTSTFSLGSLTGGSIRSRSISPTKFFQMPRIPSPTRSTTSVSPARSDTSRRSMSPSKFMDIFKSADAKPERFERAFAAFRDGFAEFENLDWKELLRAPSGAEGSAAKDIAALLDGGKAGYEAITGSPAKVAFHALRVYVRMYVLPKMNKRFVSKDVQKALQSATSMQFRDIILGMSEERQRILQAFLDAVKSIVNKLQTRKGKEKVNIELSGEAGLPPAVVWSLLGIELPTSRSSSPHSPVHENPPPSPGLLRPPSQPLKLSARPASLAPPTASSYASSTRSSIVSESQQSNFEVFDAKSVASYEPSIVSEHPFEVHPVGSPKKVYLDVGKGLPFAPPQGSTASLQIPFDSMSIAESDNTAELDPPKPFFSEPNESISSMSLRSIAKAASLRRAPTHASQKAEVGLDVKELEEEYAMMRKVSAQKRAEASEQVIPVELGTEDDSSAQVKPPVAHTARVEDDDLVVIDGDTSLDADPESFIHTAQRAVSVSRPRLRGQLGIPNTQITPVSTGWQKENDFIWEQPTSPTVEESEESVLEDLMGEFNPALAFILQNNG
ncbi:hypothetical protein YB2330_000606 [Saitoella coloradoensis]